ncbi:unnamed protein product, partial [Nesidiocoris tenuis]
MSGQGGDQVQTPHFNYQHFPTLPLPPVPYGTIAIPFFLTVGNAGKCQGLWQMVT